MVCINMRAYMCKYSFMIVCIHDAFLCSSHLFLNRIKASLSMHTQIWSSTKKRVMELVFTIQPGWLTNIYVHSRMRKAYRHLVRTKVNQPWHMPCLKIPATRCRCGRRPQGLGKAYKTRGLWPKESRNSCKSPWVHVGMEYWCMSCQTMNPCEFRPAEPVDFCRSFSDALRVSLAKSCLWSSSKLRHLHSQTRQASRARVLLVGPGSRNKSTTGFLWAKSCQACSRQKILEFQPSIQDEGIGKRLKQLSPDLLCCCELEAWVGIRRKDPVLDVCSLRTRSSKTRARRVKRMLGGLPCINKTWADLSAALYDIKSGKLTVWVFAFTHRLSENCENAGQRAGP